MASDDEGWFSRERVSTLVLAVVTVLACYVCYVLAVPFLPALAWGLALAIVAHPMHIWLEGKLGKPGVAAGISVGIVALALILPALFVVTQMVGQLTANAQELQSRFMQAAEEYEFLQPFAEQLQQQQLSQESQDAVKTVARQVPNYLGGTLWAAAQMLFTAFILFYFFRDWREVLKGLKSLLPLTTAETNRTFERIEDTIFATLYGSVVVALVQGAMGGLIFGLLGLPAALLWGVIMGLLAVIPTLGTFIVWGPAALFLALNGEYFKAAALVAWGCVAIGLIDNLLYPMLVGKRLRLHPLLVFIAIVGGIASFGMAGVVLGPVALSVTDALIEVWRRRTAHGRTAETALG
jgi:predicted PurR-regulated permease PerM